ncbi:pyridoxal-dependent decarboxylase [Edaphovirga cremea]|uniref:pyridoxal-dependent decarboxylase n=1 Tax=Edaphovirga cremea TaxID=2267246 RepID=UPI000DEF2098|nr:pyridoxal-dependent decarboxylase [Edaphovirga cremea]
MMSPEKSSQQNEIIHDKQYYIGVQVNLSPLDSLSQNMAPALRYLTNNLGDCYQSQHCPLPNSMDDECEAVEIMATLLGLPKDECWGYIGGGSTLGNLQGMWIGRTLYPDATLVFSKSAHYSIYKFASLLGFTQVKIINDTPSGAIDLADFQAKISPDEDIVMVLTAGTTMTCAYDPIDRCVELLSKNNSRIYLHLDAALGGFVIPYIDESILNTPTAEYTFSNPAISSVTVSTHKVLGTPMPANIFVCRKEIAEKFKCCVNEVPYLGQIKDITVYGSRDGFRASTVLSRLKEMQSSRLYDLVHGSLEKIDFIIRKLQKMGLENVFTNPAGLAVVMSLATFQSRFYQEGQQFLKEKYHLVQDNHYLHLYVMGHVSQAICAEFLDDCAIWLIPRQEKVAQLP